MKIPAHIMAGANPLAKAALARAQGQGGDGVPSALAAGGFSRPGQPRNNGAPTAQQRNEAADRAKASMLKICRSPEDQAIAMAAGQTSKRQEDAAEQARAKMRKIAGS